jgi:hypothetical protein
VSHCRAPLNPNQMCERVYPKFFSISRRINTPPFDDSVPPSNVAVIVFPPTGDRPGKNSVVSVMVSGALVTHDHVSTTESYVSRPV